MRPSLFAFAIISSLPACGGEILGGQTLPENGYEHDADASPDSAPGTMPPSELPPTSQNADPNDVWLAFDAQGDGASRLFIARSDGSDLRPLTLGVSATEPAFSPNGKALAFGGPSGLVVMDLKSGTLSQITTQSGDGTPAWSPDGRFLAFTRDVSIYVVGADGSGERRYIKGPPPGQEWFSNYGHPAFTKDGGSLLFDRRGAIEMGDFDGTHVRTLIALGHGDISMVALSPSGTELLLGGGCDGGSEIDIVSLVSAGEFCRSDAGSSPVVEDAEVAARPAWSSNGLIAYVDQEMLSIWVVPANGGARTHIHSGATGGDYLGDVAWSPPGTVIP